MRLASFLICSLAAAQTPSFEAADVHVSASGATQSDGFLPNGRVEIRATTMLQMISMAYSTPVDRISGGPAWLDTDRFDVTARAPGGTPGIAMRTMLQGLLAERFGLQISQEDKPMPVFVLSPGKGSPPKANGQKGDPNCQRGFEDGLATLTCKNVTLANLAERLPATAPGYFNRPVIDRSGLQGAYDFTLRWMGRGQLQGGEEGNALSLYNAVEKQFGVKITQDKAPQPVIAISAVNRTPTPNAPNVTEKLGATPTEFDVADVKLSAPGTQPDIQIDNGRIVARAVPIKDLIQFAWNVEDDAVRGGEKWLTSDRYDIVAKTAPTESEDTLRVMVQSLLAERFALKVHTDTQPVNVYALTAVKPKLRDAAPGSRSTCQQGVADGLRTLTCTNMTMPLFAERIRRAAGGYLDHPVVDLTGLKGSYDFTVSWSPVRQTRGPDRAGNPSGEATAPVPQAQAPVGLTIFESVDRHLGLKLAAQKYPMKVIVIDHLERKPTAN